MSTLALTGATGFVGKATVERALAAGHAVRALTRRPQPPREGVSWIAGSLEDAVALDALVAGADAVIHIAGVVNAPTRAGFEAGNATGTAAVIAAMQRAGVVRLVHVSSLAAREPGLSDYGWSKAEAERHVQASGLDWTMIRPPAIYGPGDAELLELFQMATRGFVLLPPGGRLSAIHVDDLAELLVRLGTQQCGETQGKIYEVDDGTPEGWSHVDFARAIGRAVGRASVRTISMPSALVRLGARIDRLLRGDKARLTPDRAAYFCHADWVSKAALHPPVDLWRPAIATEAGLAMTAQAYRDKGLLPR
ncbi:MULTISPECIES: NAD-dependent epimerase/dehydratase family protein [unclassified Sphingobium]|uniref:NAD-dependent epimerase/dehydratase family protein n=1 Tax=unclassified Sphingobium TaxID=2611147 RepID=UPI0022252473|nr:MULTISPECIES: NAD(P)H-binding protein [unclassified Sphingobium]